ncbi:DUF4124 domain-containing protein, partial [Duganella callida]
MKSMIAVLLWGATLAAYAQTVYKCKQAEKITYSDAPCPAGADASTLATPAAPAADP